jgi:hypothetical protein
MAPSPSPARRLPLLGCVLLGAAALLLPGCGNDSAATADSSARASQPRPRPKAQAVAGKPCPAKVYAFVKSLDALRRQLAVGLSYEQYAARVKALRRSYDELPIDRLTIECVTATGTPAEAALNKYIDATNAWGDCLADASCTTAAIEPVLQRRWRIASGSLSEAQ